MPFAKTADPPTNYDVRIFFGGLLMLSPRGSECHVHVVKEKAKSVKHELSVDVFVDRDHPNFPILRLGNKVLKHGLSVEATAPTGVKRYNGPDLPGVYTLDDAIDFKTLHAKAKVKPSDHRAVIKINDGVLHTATRREQDVWLRKGTAGDPFTKEPLGLELGIRVQIPPNQRLTLNWVEGQLSLPRVDQEGKPEDLVGTKFVILVNNHCPTPGTTSDFPDLYEALDEVPTDPELRYELHFKNPKVHRETTVRIPCIPGINDE